MKIINEKCAISGSRSQRINNIRQIYQNVVSGKKKRIHDALRIFSTTPYSLETRSVALEKIVDKYTASLRR